MNSTAVTCFAFEANSPVNRLKLVISRDIPSGKGALDGKRAPDDVCQAKLCPLTLFQRLVREFAFRRSWEERKEVPVFPRVRFPSRANRETFSPSMLGKSAFPRTLWEWPWLRPPLASRDCVTTGEIFFYIGDGHVHVTSG